MIAQTPTYESVEGNVYFPPESLNMDYFKESPHTSVCGWKGLANYYTVAVDGKENAVRPRPTNFNLPHEQNAAWVYRTPKDAAKNIEV